MSTREPTNKIDAYVEMRKSFLDSGCNDERLKHEANAVYAKFTDEEKRAADAGCFAMCRRRS